VGRGTAGRRTLSDGDSVGSSRAKLTHAATRLKRSLEQAQAETPGSHTGAPILQPEDGQRRGKPDEQQHPVCSLLKAAGALPIHCSHGGLAWQYVALVRAEQAREAQELHGMTQATEKVPAHGSPLTRSWFYSSGTQLQPHTQPSRTMPATPARRTHLP